MLDGISVPRAGHTVVTAGAVSIALSPRREGDDGSTPEHGRHIALRVPATERQFLIDRLAELGSEYETVRGAGRLGGWAATQGPSALALVGTVPVALPWGPTR